jgi:hypothetical protein
MQHKNTPLDNETCLTFYKLAPDADKVAEAMFSAIQTGFEFTWGDYCDDYIIARDAFKQDFIKALKTKLDGWE